MKRIEPIAKALASVGEAISPTDASDVPGLGELVLLATTGEDRLPSPDEIRELAAILADYGWDEDGTAAWLESLVLRPGEALLM